MMKKSLVLVSMAVVVAVLVAGIAGGFGAGDTPAVYASRVAGISAAGETGIQIQNLDQADSASVSADFYKSKDGGLVQTINAGPIAPGAAANIYLPGTTLPTGAYAAIINGDKQIAAIARTDWPSSGGAAIYSNVIPGTDVALPLAVRQYYGQSSLVSIQNTDETADATVTVEVYATGSTSAAVSPTYTIKPGTSITLDLEQDTEFTSLGTQFLGSLRVKSATEVGVQSFVDIVTSEKAVYAFEGVPAENAAMTLYAPLFRANQHPVAGNAATGRIDTGISVVNPGTAPVDVYLTYYGADNPSASGACRGQTFTSPTRTIGPSSSYVFYQGDPSSENLPPEDCFGSAVIHSTGGVLAIVNDSQNLGMTAAAFNAVTVEQGATTVALPLYRREHAGGLSTGISVMNLGATQASITVSFSQATPGGGSQPVSCGSPCTQTVAPNSIAVFWPPAISALPTNTYGSATINSTEPVAVIVNDVNVSGAVDAATYNGLKADFQ
jgi:hypothetical protein